MAARNRAATVERPRRNSPANIPADVHGNWKRGGGWNEEESRRGGVLFTTNRSCSCAIATPCSSSSSSSPYFALVSFERREEDVLFFPFFGFSGSRNCPFRVMAGSLKGNSLQLQFLRREYHCAVREALSFSLRLSFNHSSRLTFEYVRKIQL